MRREDLIIKQIKLKDDFIDALYDLICEDKLKERMKLKYKVINLFKKSYENNN